MSATNHEHDFPESRPSGIRLSSRSWGLLGTIVILAVSLVAFRYKVLSPRTWVTRDDRPEFRIDPAAPFQLEFGRGSSLDGFDTVKFDQSGRIVLHRIKYERLSDSIENLERYCETATLHLSKAAIATIVEALASNRVMALHRAYHSDVRDGTQWIFWVKQGNLEKAIFFDNNFPEAINRFAAELDATLSNAGPGEVAWERLPAGDYDEDVRARIRR